VFSEGERDRPIRRPDGPRGKKKDSYGRDVDLKPHKEEDIEIHDLHLEEKKRFSPSGSGMPCIWSVTLAAKRGLRLSSKKLADVRQRREENEVLGCWGLKIDTPVRIPLVV